MYIPRGAEGGEPIFVDLVVWAKAEARIAEIAAVTPAKAPELLSAFNRAALELDRLGNMLELEYQISLREAAKVKAVVLLDRVPKILAEKGLATAKSPMGSEDIRIAILDQDQEYDRAQERSELLKAATKLIKGKHDAFERAFRSVRTLVGEQNFNYGGGTSKELSHSTSESKPVGIKPSGFGAPKYANAPRPRPATAVVEEEPSDIPY